MMDSSSKLFSAADVNAGFDFDFAFSAELSQIDGISIFMAAEYCRHTDLSFSILCTDGRPQRQNLEREREERERSAEWMQ